MTNKENSIAKAISIIGIITIVGGCISGIHYGTSEEFYGLGDFQSVIGLILAFSGIVWGILLLGFSEIIKLLQGIFNQGEKLSPSEEENMGEPINNNTVTDHKFVVTERAENEIKDFFQSKGLKVLEVVETNEEDVYLVTLDEGNIEYVDLGGFKPRIVTK
jgi:hypothetical protein